MRDNYKVVKYDATSDYFFAIQKIYFCFAKKEKQKKFSMWVMSLWVSVCMWETERERERESKREKGQKRQKGMAREKDWKFYEQTNFNDQILTQNMNLLKSL